MTIVSAQDIFDLNKNKEYTLTASSILEKVLTDNRICSQAAKLWHYLYNKSKYDVELCLRISYSKIAKSFEKSVRTIARWINSLLNAGYLHIKHNYDQSGSQISNTLYVRLPKDVFEHARMTKNRSSKQKDDSFSGLNKSYSETTIHSTDEISLLHTECENTQTEDSLVLTEINSNFENPIEENLSLSETIICASPEVYPTPLSVLPERTEQEKANLADKIVRGEGDIFDRHCLLVFKEEENNNNTSVVVNESESIEPLEKEILQINASIQQENENLKTTLEEHKIQNTLEKQSHIMNRIGRLEHYKYTLEQKKKDRISQIQQKIALDKNNALLNKNLTAMLNAQGERILPNSLFKRLLQTLSGLGHKGTALVRFANEIVFESRFGSLTKAKNGNTLPIEKSVNIGIKLLREKRWQTPSGIGNFVQQLVP